MIQIEESNPSFESCNKCIYSDDSEETCILRRCIHAVTQLNECYVPKQPTIEPERKKGRWIPETEDWRNQIVWVKCSECGFDTSTSYNYCPNCGCRMDGGEQDE